MALVPDIAIVFTLNGQRKELRYRNLPFSIWSELKSQLSFTPTSLLDAVQNYDLEALGAIIWLERKQHERTLRWPEVRADLERNDADLEFLNASVDGRFILGEESNEAEPDPTPASS